MIIIGYQGIGKSTLAKSDNKYIDLESSIYFRLGVRPENWYYFYGKTAEYLSRQGYTVFVSSHKEVREYFRQSTEQVIVICPNHHLKNQWISKLEHRYIQTKKEKDFRAWQNAKNKFDENITEIIRCGLPVILLNSMEYNLKSLIEGANHNEKNSI